MKLSDCDKIMLRQAGLSKSRKCMGVQEQDSRSRTANIRSKYQCDFHLDTDLMFWKIIQNHTFPFTLF